MAALADQLRRWAALKLHPVVEPGGWVRNAHPEIRALMLQFPPACVVTCSSMRPAPCPEPGRLGIVTGWAHAGLAVRVQVVDLLNHLRAVRPESALEIELAKGVPATPHLVDPSLLSVIAFRNGWRPEDLRAQLH